MDEDYRVKIADATLSRDIYELDYYKPGEKAKALPVKWMSPEALEHDLFTCKGDVVSPTLTIIYFLLERETFIYFRLLYYFHQRKQPLLAVVIWCGDVGDFYTSSDSISGDPELRYEESYAYWSAA